MKVKIIILYLIFLTFSYSYVVGQDSIKFSNTLNSLKKSVELKDLLFIDQDSSDILLCPKNELFTEQTSSFTDEIIGYEYDSLNVNEKDSIYKLLTKYHDGRNLFSGEFICSVLDYDSNNCEYVLFFSKPNNNRMMFLIEPYNYRNKNLRDYMRTIGVNFILGLIYFDSNENIVKVFLQKNQRF